VAVHRSESHPRRRLAIGAGAAVVVLGVLVAVLALRPADEAVRDTGSAALLVPTTAVVPPPPAVVVPPVPAATTTTTSARPTTTTATTTSARRSSTTRAVAAAPAGEGGRVLTLVNAARADAGCRALTRSAALDRAAADYAALMARTGTFSHTGPDGSEFSDRIRAAGYPDPGGENIAKGQSSADEVMADWMDSPGHRRNILDCSFRTLGVGHADDGDYWAQEFGR